MADDEMMRSEPYMLAADAGRYECPFVQRPCAADRCMAWQEGYLTRMVTNHSGGLSPRPGAKGGRCSLIAVNARPL